MTGRADIPIVLCCAEDDEPQLAQVVDQLHREGMAPELVTGVEVDVSTFSASVDEARGPALFVVCQSGTLDRATARRLTGLFSARRGAGQRIVTVTFQGSRPLAILPAIRVAFQQAVLAADEVIEEAEGGGSHLRDVVESLTDTPVAASPPPPASDLVAREPPARADAERLARELAEGLAEAEAILDRRSEDRRNEGAPRGRTRTPPVIMPEVSEPVKPAARETQTAPARAGAGAGAPPSPTNLAAALDAVVPSHSGVMRAAVETDPDTSRLPRREGKLEPPRVVRSADEPGGNRWLLAAAGLGVAVIVALALLQIVQPQAEPSARERSAPFSASDRAKNDGASPASAGVQPTVPNARALPVAETPTVVEAKAPPPASDPPPMDPIDTPPTEAAVAADATKAASVPPAPPVTSKRDAETTLFDHAAREGKLDVVGRLWVAKISSETTTWHEAASRCRTKQVAGVGGFRLPTRSDLRRLRNAKVLEATSYWSRDKGEAGDEAFTLDGGSGNELVYLLEEPNGAAICVRTR